MLTAVFSSLSKSKPLAKEVPLGPTDTLKLLLTTTTNSSPQRPHQAFLTLTDPTTGLSTSLPFQVRDTGKAKLELSAKSLPPNLNATSLLATLVLGSFGPSTPYNAPLFTLAIASDPNAPPPTYAKPERYGRAEEIHHIFRPEPASPPKIISIVFLLAVVATVPVLLGAWGLLGANLGGLGAALKTAPLSHAAFYGSLVAMEAVFGMYYWRWNLFKVLPVAGVVAVVGFLAGSKALSEVQARRLRGER